MLSFRRIEQIVIGSLVLFAKYLRLRRVLIENALDGLIESFRYWLLIRHPLFTQCRIQIHFTNADLAVQNSDYVNYVRVLLVPFLFRLDPVSNANQIS